MPCAIASGHGNPCANFVLVAIDEEHDHFSGRDTCPVFRRIAGGNDQSIARREQFHTILELDSQLTFNDPAYVSAKAPIGLLESFTEFDQTHTAIRANYLLGSHTGR